MKKLLLFLLWFIYFMVVWNLVGGWVSAPSTFLLFMGLILAVVFGVITFKTKCFTSKWGK